MRNYREHRGGCRIGLFPEPLRHFLLEDDKLFILGKRTSQRANNENEEKSIKMRDIFEEIGELANHRYFKHVMAAIVVILLMILVADFSAIVTKREIVSSMGDIYEKGYIEGFRKARSYEIKDTVELNHIYPTWKLMMKYEPMNEDTICH